MNIALIALPNINTPTQDAFCNLHGYWNPPEFVMEFWASSCKIEYFGEDAYEIKKVIVCKSYMEAIKQFYKDNAF